MLRTLTLEEPPESNPAQPEHLLWSAVIERAVMDSREGGIHARTARDWLLVSPDFLLVAFYVGSSDPETLRVQIRRGLDQDQRTPRRPGSRRGSRGPRLTLLTAPPGMPMWEIAEKTARAARVV
jgi:hypothetical protein